MFPACDRRQIAVFPPCLLQPKNEARGTMLHSLAIRLEVARELQVRRAWLAINPSAVCNLLRRVFGHTSF